MRPFWIHYYTGTSGVVFVVDASDRVRSPDFVRSLFLPRSRSSLLSLTHHTFLASLLPLFEMEHFQARIEKARDEFARVVGDEQLSDVSILLLANKQDMPGALSRDDMEESFDVKKLAGSRQWKIVTTIAKNGTGLVEAFGWLSESMEKR